MKKTGVHEIGVIHGRFQILHNDHLAYLLAGKARCRHLVVGITHPDPVHTAPEPSDPGRGARLANPLTYYERLVMIRDCLTEVGVSEAQVTLVPFPIHAPSLYGEYLPLEAVFFLTIYDRWGRAKLERFQALGLQTEVLWERPSAEKGITANEVRARILADEPWRALVPAATARWLEVWDMAGRLRRLAGKSE